MRAMKVDHLRVADGDGVEPIERGVVVLRERAQRFEDALDQRRVAGGDGGLEERSGRRGDAKDVLTAVANASRECPDAHADSRQHERGDRAKFSELVDVALDERSRDTNDELDG